jgi:hypothetical protein
MIDIYMVFRQTRATHGAASSYVVKRKFTIKTDIKSMWACLLRSTNTKGPTKNPKKPDKNKLRFFLKKRNRRIWFGGQF